MVRAFPRRPRGAQVEALLDLRRRLDGAEFGSPADNVSMSGTLDHQVVVDDVTVSSMDATGHANYSSLAVDQDLMIGGQSVAGDGGLLWSLPRGVVDGSLGNRNMGGVRTSDLEYGFLEIGADVSADRTYKIHVEPFHVWNEPGTSTLRLRYTYGGEVPTVDSNVLESAGGLTATAGETSLLVMGGTFLLRPVFTTRVNVLISVGSDTGVRFPGSALADVTVWIEDVGPATHQGGRDRNSRTPASGGTKPPEPTDLVKRKLQAVWSPSSFRSYQGNGSTYTWAGQTNRLLFQGTSPAGYGTLSSIATFGGNVDFLSGAEITRVRAKFKVASTYYRSGGTVQLGLHGESSPPSTRPSRTFVTNKTAKAGDTVTVDIPESFWAGILAGTHRGLAFGNLATGYGYYLTIEASSIRWIIDYLK